ncbi:phosphoglycolate phosphatase [Oceaniovalibus guishaninsula]|nr:phosphoglycolate phosphatase [Oceaniovalibus guishaninsula]
MIAAIFDLDGTLIDSAPDIHAACNAVLAEAGGRTLSLARMRDFIGDGAPALIRRAMAEAGLGRDDALHARLLAAFLDRYERAVDLTRPYAGALAALDRLARAGHPLGLCTNKPIAPTRAVLAHFCIADRFGAIVGGDSLPQRKPDPAPLRAAMRDLHADRCIFVGDSEVDAQTARAAGMPFALFTRGYLHAPLAETPHDAAFDDWTTLPGLIEALA